MFVWQAARARDFNRYLSGWHARTWWKKLLGPIVQRVWRSEGRCQHKPLVEGLPHWCRARDTEMRVPPLGEVER